MKKISINKMAFIALLFLNTSSVVANANDLAGDFTQSIQVVNLLGNTNLPNPGMTPTPIIVRYYNGGQNPCWTTTLNFHDDSTIHAGPTQGCLNKVSEVIISPVAVFDKLKTYLGPITIHVDTSKYSTQITVIQDKEPLFDPQTGLVSLSGTMKALNQANGINGQ